MHIYIHMYTYNPNQSKNWFKPRVSVWIITNVRAYKYKYKYKYKYTYTCNRMYAYNPSQSKNWF